MAETYLERRESKRHQIQVPIDYGHGVGISRDISFTGIYFTTEKPLSSGERLKLAFELEYAIPGKSLQLDCQGYVLRVDILDDHFGVAAKIDEITYLN
jgi:hypothetical protein